MTPGATNLLQLVYEYGATAAVNNGNVTKQTITVPTVGQTPGFTAVQDYSYDSLNRLKSATENITPTGGSQSMSWEQTFEFDRYGNRNFVEANTTFTGFIGMSAASRASPQTLNMYTYCGNDPVNYTDPSGLDFGSIFRWIGRAIMSLFRSGTARRIAVRFVVSYALSGGNFSVAIQSVAPDILRQLGLGPPNGLLTPSWNPNLPYPVSFGVSPLNKYIIANLATNAEIVRAAVDRALDLLKRGRCRRFIQENHRKWDPSQVLSAIRSGGIVLRGSWTIGGAVAQADAGAGPKSQIRLTEKWLDKGVGGWAGTLNPEDTRALVILHELKHVVGGTHDETILQDGKWVRKDDMYYFRGIATNCFGVSLPENLPALPSL